MAISVIYFVVVLGLGIICVVIGFLSGPNRLKKPVPVSAVPAGNMGDGYARFNYPGEEQDFLNELEKRLMELKSNWSEDYQKEKERRDVVAFFEYCNAGLLKDSNTGDSGQ